MAASKNTTENDNITTNDIMAAVDKKIAAMLEEAQKKADAIVAQAQAKAEAKPDIDEATKKANDELEKYVEVKLFKDNGKYKDDVFVSVNGENCLIKRGVKVKIKKKFALVLEQSDLQDYMTSQLMESKEAEYQKASRELNM